MDEYSRLVGEWNEAAQRRADAFAALLEAARADSLADAAGAESWAWDAAASEAEEAAFQAADAAEREAHDAVLAYERQRRGLDAEL